MTSRYLCKKCMFTTDKFSGMQRHLTKKNLCKKNLESYNYSDDQLLILSLLPQCDDYNENEKIKEELSYLTKSNTIYKKKDKLFCDINYIDKNKCKKCIYCNEDFEKILDLKKHLLMKCFYNELLKNKEEVDNINIHSVNNAEHSYNTTNTNSNNNNTTNIYLQIKSPIPFDSDWDLSNICNKDSLVFSNYMYTSLLEEILKNEINLNVIIDKDNESGMVYKNDIDKYIEMKSKDIVDNILMLGIKKI